MAAKIFDRLLESLFRGTVSGTPAEVALVVSVEMPLSEETRLIACFRKGLGNGSGFQLEINRKRWSSQRCRDILVSCFVLYDELESVSSGGIAGEEGGAGRGSRSVRRRRLA